MPIPSCWLQFIYFSLISHLPTITLCILEKQKIPELAALQWTETLGLDSPKSCKAVWDAAPELFAVAKPLDNEKMRIEEVLEKALLPLGPGCNVRTRHRVFFHAKMISLCASDPTMHLQGQEVAPGMGWFAGQVCGEK